MIASKNVIPGKRSCKISCLIKKTCFNWNKSTQVCSISTDWILVSPFTESCRGFNYCQLLYKFFQDIWSLLRSVGSWRPWKIGRKFHLHLPFLAETTHWRNYSYISYQPQIKPDKITKQNLELLFFLFWYCLMNNCSTIFFEFWMHQSKTKPYSCLLTLRGKTAIAYSQYQHGIRQEAV